MLFKTLNFKIEKNAYDIEVKNIDAAMGHWGNEKRIENYLDNIEEFIYNKEMLDKNLVLHAIRLFKENRRLKDAKFYRDGDKVILLAITEVHKFKEFDAFSREMTISFKRDKFAFSIIELLESEEKDVKEGIITIPESWKLDEQLTNRLTKLRDFL